FAPVEWRGSPVQRCKAMQRGPTGFRPGCRRGAGLPEICARAPRRYRRSTGAHMKLFVCLVILTLFATAFAADPETERLKPALDAITPDGLLAHIKLLASDEFEGRAPGSKGEELSIKYISDQFKQIGLSPGNADAA